MAQSNRSDGFATGWFTMKMTKKHLKKILSSLVDGLALESINFEIQTPIEMMPDQYIGGTFIPAQQFHTGEVILILKGKKK